MVRNARLLVHILRARIVSSGLALPGRFAERVRRRVQGRGSRCIAAPGKSVFHFGATAGRTYGRAASRAWQRHTRARVWSRTVHAASPAFLVSECAHGTCTLLQEVA